MSAIIHIFKCVIMTINRLVFSNKEEQMIRYEFQAQIFSIIMVKSPVFRNTENRKISRNSGRTRNSQNFTENTIFDEKKNQNTENTVNKS